MDDDLVKKDEQLLARKSSVRKKLQENIKMIAKPIKHFFTELFNNVHEIPLSLRIICKYMHEFTKDKIE